MFEKIQRFMYGRYGLDKLSIALIIAGFVFSILGRLFFYPLFIISYAFYIYAIFRMFSKNTNARYREYSAFLKVYTKIKNFFLFQRNRFKERKLYKYFRCPNCKQKLRAPKNRGKIQVTCQKCHKQFITKT